MKIFVASDLHLEFGEYPHKIPECDLIILAGDTGKGINGIKWAKTLPYPIVQISGNHEMYGQKLDLYNKLYEESKDSNVHFLQNDIYIHDHVRILGATLWTDYNLYGNQYLAMITAGNGLNDFNNIRTGAKYGYRKVKPTDFSSEFLITKTWLQEELSKPFDGETIVVTHHLPSEKSIHEMYANNRLNPAYASNLENLIVYNNIKYWIHGHTHNSCDYMIGDTRIICNPFGYLSHEVNPNFNPNFIIEI